MEINSNALLICGAGGHAKVVLDAALCSNSVNDIILLDDAKHLIGTSIMGVNVLGPMLDQFNFHQNDNFHIAIGYNKRRQELISMLQQLELNLVSIRYPDSICSKFATVNHGSFLAARSVIGPNASIGIGSIINHGAVVDHDCQIGNYVHIAPNATLGGNVTVGEGSLIGANATILPGLTIGKWVTVGAGAVVTQDIADSRTVKGIPAR